MEALIIVIACVLFYLLLVGPQTPSSVIMNPRSCDCSQSQSGGRTYFYSLYTGEERRFKKTWEDPHDEDQY